MSDKRINTVLARQQKHIVRDALAVVLVAVGLGLAAMTVAFHLPSSASVEPQKELTPARATAEQLSEMPPW